MQPEYRDKFFGVNVPLPNGVRERDRASESGRKRGVQQEDEGWP